MGNKQNHRVLRQQDYGGCKLSVFATGETAVVQTAEGNLTDFGAKRRMSPNHTLFPQQKGQPVRVGLFLLSSPCNFGDFLLYYP